LTRGRHAKERHSHDDECPRAKAGIKPGTPLYRLADRHDKWERQMSTPEKRAATREKQRARDEQARKRKRSAQE